MDDVVVSNSRWTIIDFHFVKVFKADSGAVQVNCHHYDFECSHQLSNGLELIGLINLTVDTSDHAQEMHHF